MKPADSFRLFHELWSMLALHMQISVISSADVVTGIMQTSV